MNNNPANLPYEMKTGWIRRRDYDMILPQHRVAISDEAAFLEILAGQVRDGDFSFCPAAEMTISKYVHVWAAAFRGQFTNLAQALARESARTDDELFQLHHGYDDEFDLDSPDDFVRWFRKYENGCHMFDIKYARLSLFPVYEGESVILDLFTTHMSELDTLARVAVELRREGIPFRISYADEMLAVLDGEDFIRISPAGGNDSLCNPRESLPVIGGPEDLNELGQMECGLATREQYDCLVEAIEWGPEKYYRQMKLELETRKERIRMLEARLDDYLSEVRELKRKQD